MHRIPQGLAHTISHHLRCSVFKVRGTTPTRSRTPAARNPTTPAPSRSPPTATTKERPHCLSPLTGFTRRRRVIFKVPTCNINYSIAMCPVKARLKEFSARKTRPLSPNRADHRSQRAHDACHSGSKHHATGRLPVATWRSRKLTSSRCPRGAPCALPPQSPSRAAPASVR